MINSIKKYVRYLLDRFLPMFWYMNTSYSQDGEDIVLKNFFEDIKKTKGFYVDVGAHHPYRFSNTALFYKNGWNGINIEPTPSLFKKFTRLRKRDINLNIGISNTQDSLNFYEFNEGAYNTFDASKVDSILAKSPKYTLVNTQKIDLLPLSDIFSKYIHNREIDFMSIDVEGLDYKVLLSNDWNTYRPKFILVECYPDFDNINQDRIYHFLKGQNYEMVSYTYRTAFFKSIS